MFPTFLFLFLFSNRMLVLHALNPWCHIVIFSIEIFLICYTWHNYFLKICLMICEDFFICFFSVPNDVMSFVLIANMALPTPLFPPPQTSWWMWTTWYCVRKCGMGFWWELIEQVQVPHWVLQRRTLQILQLPPRSYGIHTQIICQSGPKVDIPKSL